MQLRLSEDDRRALINRIDDDWHSAQADHAERMERFRRYYRAWRNRVQPQAAGKEHEANYSDPLIQTQVQAKWARDMQALLGDDAEIVAKPRGASDYSIVKKTGLFASWRIFDYMKIAHSLAVFDFRRIVFGRAFAYVGWKRETYMVRTPQGDREEIAYDGPCFEPEWPDDIVVPAQANAKCIHDFQWVIRKQRLSVDDILAGAQAGRFDSKAVRKLLPDLRRLAAENRQREPQGDEIQRENDEAEGVIYEGGLSHGNAVTIWSWYGKHRPTKAKDTDRDVEIVAHYVPDLKALIGAQDLMDLYPLAEKRRPFFDSGLIPDGSFWCPGFAETLETEADELSRNHNLFTEAGQFSVAPAGFYTPAAGMPADKPMAIQPGTMNPVADSNAIKFVPIPFNPQYNVVKDQSIRANVERKTGLSDFAMGRTPDRPNTPKTASATIAMMEDGNLLNSFSVLFLREDMGRLLEQIWLLECQFANDRTFFRVTEQDAAGTGIQSQGGFAPMSADEFQHNFDFELKFATTVWQREAKKQQTLALYQLSLQNPLIATNPQALYKITADVFEALGRPLGDLVPEPPDMGMPKNPREEWAMLLSGREDEVRVHPEDNDDLHLIDHQKRLMEYARAPQADEKTAYALISHIHEHEDQKASKLAMKAMAESLADRVAAGVQAVQGGGLQALLGSPGGIPPGEEEEPQPGTLDYEAGQTPDGGNPYGDAA